MSVLINNNKGSHDNEYINLKELLSSILYNDTIILLRKYIQREYMYE